MASSKALQTVFELADHRGFSVAISPVGDDGLSALDKIGCQPLDMGVPSRATWLVKT